MPTVIHLSAGLDIAFHQYYDIPAWNADGSTILFRGPKDKAYLCRAPGEPPAELILPARPAGSIQWDRKDPRVLYYLTREEDRRTVVHRFNLPTGEESIVCRIDAMVNLTPPHEDGEHLLTARSRRDEAGTGFVLRPVTRDHDSQIWNSESGHSNLEPGLLTLDS